jgi:hypothetical protein
LQLVSDSTLSVTSVTFSGVLVKRPKLLNSALSSAGIPPLDDDDEEEEDAEAAVTAQEEADRPIP